MVQREGATSHPGPDILPHEGPGRQGTAPRVTAEVTLDLLERILDHNRPLPPALVFDLKEKGREVGNNISPEQYGTMELFYAAHDAGRSPLVALDGPSSRMGDLFILTACPLGPQRRAFFDHKGRLPKFFDKVEDTYNRAHAGRSAILNPLCILHQMAQQCAARRISVGRVPLIFRHVASRSELTGKRVRSQEGIDLAMRRGFTRERIEDILDTGSCLVMFKNSSQP